jgi:serine phosphatase RsbU (regulator of sigma subunit)
MQNGDSIRKDLRKKIKELEFLMAASRLLNSSLNFDRVLSVIIKLVKNALGVEAVSLLLLDEDKKNLRFVLARGRKDNQIRGMKVPLGEGIAGWVAKNGKPLIVNNIKKDSRYSIALSKKIGLKTHSSICIPLRLKGNLIGVLEGVNRGKRKPFTAEDLTLFTALSDHVAAAVENARLYTEVKRKNLENRLLYQVAMNLGKSLSLEESLGRIMASLKKLVPYDAAAIFLLDRKRDMIFSIAREGYGDVTEEKLRLKLDEGLVGWAAAKKEGLIVGDCRKDPRYVPARRGTRSEMVAPMLARGHVIGLFNLESDRLNAYRMEDLRLVESFAAYAAVTIERARLYEDHRERLELQREIRLGRTIQEFFTPKKAKKAGNYYITGVNHPGKTVSGDYYDFFPLKNGAVAFVIADVAGKGVPASIIMSGFRSSLHTAAISFVGAKEIAWAANRMLLETVRQQDFVTAFIGVLFPHSGEIIYCNAGHNPPVVMDKSGRYRFLEIGGTVLGVFEDPFLVEGRFMLGDEVLFCYTDGLTEARNERDEEFGMDELLKGLKSCVHLPARRICSRMYKRLLSHAGEIRLDDDVTFLIIKRRAKKS